MKKIAKKIAKNKGAKDKNGKTVPQIEVTEVVLVHSNFVSNEFLQDLKVLYILAPNKLRCQF